MIGTIIDALPERLWWPANLYRLFGAEVHLCTDGRRTIELNGRQIAHGHREFRGQAWTPTSAVQDRVYETDLGWTAAKLAALGFVVVLVLRRAARR